MPVQHAPAGGISIAGQQFKGGEFIPGEVLARATPEEKAQLAGHQAVNPFELPHPTQHPMERMEALIADTEKADKAYNALPDTMGGKIINADSARALSPEFRDSYAERIKHSLKSGKLGGKYAMGRLMRELENRGERKRLMVLAGGPAAGKSSSLGEGTLDHADLVWDTTLSDPDKAKTAMDAALKNGWEVYVRYVHADTKHWVKGLLHRTQRTGRWGNFKGTSANHKRSQNNVLAAMREYGDLIKVDLFHNDHDAPATMIEPHEIMPGGKHHVGDDHDEQADQQLEAQQGGFDPDIIRLIRGQAGPELAEGLAGRLSGEPGKNKASPEEVAAQEYKAQGVRAKAFKAWFGDWEHDPANASKVVNAKGEPQETHHVESSQVLKDGKPVAVYHGTAHGGFTEFDKDKADPNGLYGPGFYFTEDESVAREYMSGGTSGAYGSIKVPPENREKMLAEFEKRAADESIALNDPDISWDWPKTRRMFLKHGMLNYLGSGVVGSRRMKVAVAMADKFGAESEVRRGKSKGQRAPLETKAVYLNVRKPFDMTQATVSADEAKRVFGGWMTKLVKKYPYYSEGIPPGILYDKLADEHPKHVINHALAQAGYDGITHIGGGLMGGGHHHRVWIAFEPHQIKAVDNRGTFDPSNAHIRMGLEVAHYHHAIKDHDADSIFTHAAIGYAAIYDEMRAAIDRILRDAQPYDWIRLIDETIDEFRPIIGSTLAESVVASYLAGSQHVAKLIPAHAEPGAFLPPVPPLPPIRHPAFGFMPPEPFIEFPIIETAARDLHRRRLVMKSQFETLSREARHNAFTVADVASFDTMGKIREALAENVQQGASLRGFRKLAREKLGEAWETLPLSANRIENVFRTNVQTGFSRGMDAVLDHPFVADLFPYEEFLEINDGRLCQLCRTIARSGIQGTGIYRRDDPVYRHFTPPLHWLCRCARNPLQVSQAAAKGIKEAILWMETGRAPAQPVRVQWPGVELPKGWAA